MGFLTRGHFVTHPQMMTFYVSDDGVVLWELSITQLSPPSADFHYLWKIFFPYSCDIVPFPNYCSGVRYSLPSALNTGHLAALTYPHSFLQKDW